MAFRLQGPPKPSQQLLGVNLGHGTKRCFVNTFIRFTALLGYVCPIAILLCVLTQPAVANDHALLARFCRVLFVGAATHAVTFFPVKIVLFGMNFATMTREGIRAEFFWASRSKISFLAQTIEPPSTRRAKNATFATRKGTTNQQGQRTLAKTCNMHKSQPPSQRTRAIPNGCQRHRQCHIS